MSETVACALSLRRRSGTLLDVIAHSLDIFDSEGNASFLFQLGLLDPLRSRGAEDLARRVPGIAVRSDNPNMRGVHAYSTGSTVRTIWLNPRASPQARNFGCAHELMEFLLRHEISEHIEIACDQGAAAVVAPRQAFRHMLGALGEDFPRLGAAFVMDESCAILRFGEVTDTPTLLIAPGSVRVRGAEWCWGVEGEAEIRRLSRAKTLPIGLRRVHLQDDRRRIALLAA